MLPEEMAAMQQRNPSRAGRGPTLAGALVLAAGLALAPAGARATEAAPSGPVATVETFHAALLDVMKHADELGVAGRYRRLEKPVETAFYLPLMIRIASGGYWPKASEAQQKALVAAFERMSVGTYANRFDGWSGESFETVGEKPGPRGTTLVETRIVRPDEDPVRLVYVVRDVGGAFRIVDVLLDRGVSELATRRSEYQGVLHRSGVDGLIQALDHKGDELLHPAAP
jgi:phospholipid transport system substrate-binding protein